MRRRGRTPSSFPTSLEEELIRAAVLEGDAARAAWAAWRAGADLDRLDAASQRLLPLVYRQLVRLDVNDRALPVLKGLYRLTWYRNARLLHAAAAALEALERAAIPTLLLKGAALLDVYGETGTRAMEDVDVLVPRGQVLEAMAALRDAGFSPERAAPETRLGVRHSEPFTNADGASVDLHWYAMWQPFDDRDLWERSRPSALAGAATRTLDPADQLLLVCVHGAAWNDPRPIRWVVDALVLLGDAEGPLDWSRLVERARARRLTVAAHDTLEYLQREFGGAIPADVLIALRRARAGLLEQAAQRALRRPPSARRSAVVLLDHYLRSRQAGALDAGTGFTRFLLRSRGLETVWQLPGYVARKAREQGARSTRPRDAARVTRRRFSRGEAISRRS